MRCDVCNTVLVWSALAVLRVLKPRELRRMTTFWPEDKIVVVRRCICGEPIARLEKEERAPEETI